MNPEHSCNCIFSMVNDSFLCNHYHFMKMSNSDRFKECFWHKRPKNHDFTPGFGAKMQFYSTQMHPKHSWNYIILLMNYSFACYHYPFMKMSDLDDFKECILQKHPQKSRFYPRIRSKNAIWWRKLNIIAIFSFFILICIKSNDRGVY